MPKIRVLSRAVAEQIAAGEVVERPSSVLKELLENAVDAGSSRITAEIEGGGIKLMRVTDDGCGIDRDDVETAFYRHATSKIESEDDLEHIITLGFRGEALASICSVSNVEILTKTRDSGAGTVYTVSGGVGGVPRDAGCPDGTVITVRDLFFNTPARMKFLKKDVTEGNACADIAERIALSRPDIAFKFIRDGKTVWSTPGDGKLLSAVCAVLGRRFASGLIEVDGRHGCIRVSGYVSRPVYCKTNRGSQYFYLNGRLVKSATVCAALDQAYRHSIMTGKFPAAVLSLSFPPELVDVNAHPAKLEVRFSDEKLIFDAVYTVVKSALAAGDTRPELAERPRAAKPEPFEREHFPGADRSPEPKQIASFLRHIETEYPKKPSSPEERLFTANDAAPPRESAASEPEPAADPHGNPGETAEKEPAPAGDVRFIGELFATYVLAESGDAVYLIDKHAAHERILYNKLRETATVEQQMLIVPEVVSLPAADYGILCDNIPLLEKAGFDAENFGNGNIILRGVPACLTKVDGATLLSELADSLREKYTAELDRLDNLYHSVACKAAIKAGDRSDPAELKNLAETVLRDRELFYCPHGRPVAVRLTRGFIERQFGRTG